MGACHTFYDELRFDVRDPDVTHVYVFVRAEGDCPHTVYGWHHKAFPAPMTTVEIHTLLWNGEDPVLWERGVPPAMREAAIISPHEYVPVLAEELQDWWGSLVDSGRYSPVEIADRITARMTMAPDWHEACPHCRAHDMMLRVQMAPPQ